MQNDSTELAREHYLFVTGQLAEEAVRTIVSEVARNVGFKFSIVALPITVAALMTPKWLLRKLHVPAEATRIVVPGYLESGLEELTNGLEIPVDCGPRDIRDLAEFFGKKLDMPFTLDDYRIEILAEINHASALAIDDLIARAEYLAGQGANVIDLGCTPGALWSQVGVAVRELRDRGMRVSIDSFDSHEVSEACKAGAELVLSVNRSNRLAATEWGTEVVVVPDFPFEEKNFFETVNFLLERDIRVRLDPILEPIGCGFALSLGRYMECRKQFGSLPMMMGVGNLTELTDVDSAGVNLLLLGICEELAIESVLTTNVINWARTSVKECDIARRLVRHAVKNRIPPKRLDDRLVTLRDPKVHRFSESIIEQLANSIRDSNVRLLAQDGLIHFLAAGRHFEGADPFEIFSQVLDSSLGEDIDSSHAFYLGFEMCKAMTALTLDKQYDQDQALRWGYLTRNETSHRLTRNPKRSNSKRNRGSAPADD